MSVLTFRRTRRDADPVADAARAAELARLATEQAHASCRARRDRAAVPDRTRPPGDGRRTESTRSRTGRDAACRPFGTAGTAAPRAARRG